MNGPVRRGACPGLSTPMPTGDGLLVRILPRDRIAPEALIALCAAARRHGNGVIEISARGSLQVRGLTPDTAPLFAAEVAELDLAETCRVPVITDPVPDDPGTLVDCGALAASLRARIEQANLALTPKASIIIDGGGFAHLDTLAADLRLTALGSAQSPRLNIALGGDARSALPLGSIAPEEAADVVVRLLGVMATHGARAADVLRRAGPAPFQAAAALDAESAPRLPVRTPVELIGRHPQRDGHVALGLALAFGQADAEALAQLAGLARDQGAGAMRSAPGRVLLVSVLMDHRAASFAAAAERLGFITRADDPRRRIAACPGKPGCSSGWIPARILAAELASHLPPNGRGVDIHVSGCAKGCAHPAAAALTVVGSASGCGIVRHGTARATPSRWVAPDELVAELVRAANEGAHG